MHGAQDVLLGRLAHGVLLVICEQDHVLPLVAKVLDQVRGHVADVIDAASQLAALAKVVDADEQGLPAAVALGVLEGIVGRGAVAEMLWGGRWWARTIIRAGVRLVAWGTRILSERWGGEVHPQGEYRYAGTEG